MVGESGGGGQGTVWGGGVLQIMVMDSDGYCLMVIV